VKAIRVREFGGPGVLKVEDAPIPDVGPGQSLVRVHAAGVNPVDTYIRAGAYGQLPALPYTPGMDGAGVVERTGPGIAGLSPGDRVYLCRSLTGTYAQYALCDRTQVRPLPARITFEQGAAVWVAYATAYCAMVQRAAVRAAEWVLVHGASGGVGLAALQIGRALGARLIGTASTPEGLELIKQHGAAVALDHSSTDYFDEIRRLTEYPAGGVAVILEMLANINLERDLGVLAKGGRAVVIGSRATIEITPRQLMSRNSSVLGMSLHNATQAELDEAGAAINAGLDNGTLNPVVGTVLPLERAPEAHEQVMSRGARGKIVLKM